jgi:hypothetical protein
MLELLWRKGESPTFKGEGFQKEAERMPAKKKAAKKAAPKKKKK